MTSINTREARKHWKDETKFLEAIGFVVIDRKNKIISLPTDEEGNDDIVLTIKAGEWLIKKLQSAVKQLKTGKYNPKAEEHNDRYHYV